MQNLQLRIDAYTLPGRDCAPGPVFPGVSGIEVAVQRKDRPAELLDPQPGDAEAARWAFD
ncbi:DUF5990 family protein [Streptacidiphilus neutrinimicus]|uniref:DUF5990 family protein n=1 Tax=Streptacidiphilus neutrinimicus TaxID=105420 RepID=UPI000693D5C5|nr:DUF5990 family protein [Streptacidiphilus neutrinimicus]